MPEIKLTHVISYSSQDDRYPASNLLRTSSTSTMDTSSWLIHRNDAHTGRMQAEFQLEKASTITHVDIGNNGSTIVELMVSRSCWTLDQYVTLLPAFSFNVTPTIHLKRRSTTADDREDDEDDLEAESSTSSVRMFSTDDFVKDAARLQWDRLRVTCWCPYIRKERRTSGVGIDRHQFGLSFVVLKDMSACKEPSMVVDQNLSHIVHQTQIQSPGNSSVIESRSTTMVRLARAKNQPSSVSEAQGSSPRISILFKSKESPQTEHRPQIYKNTAKKKKLDDFWNDSSVTAGPSTVDQVECPICFNSFDIDQIEFHAELCLQSTAGTTTDVHHSTDDRLSKLTTVNELPDIITIDEDLQPLQISSTPKSYKLQGVACPLCSVEFPSAEIEEHASQCSLI